MEFLEFEQPIAELEAKIDALHKVTDMTDINIAEEIERLKQKSDKLTKKIFAGLSDWQVIQLARHPERPYTLDYIKHAFSDFQELHGDRQFADDHAIVGGLARLDGQPVMVIGQQKGRDTKQKLARNFGMPHPEGYRKALRLMKLAEQFNMPIITLIDTPGAYPGIQAEERGQSEAIARNLREMAELKVPVVCVVIGEGCSGGALGIGVGDVLLMMQYSYFATISPEGCATILWKTAAKAPEAAAIMGITATRLKELDIVDGIITEPFGGAHRYHAEAAQALKKAVNTELAKLQKLSVETLLTQRYEKLMRFGRFAVK
jgi:acetyl-CoA carboxylase carboxyl transferase subunit alpha